MWEPQPLATLTASVACTGITLPFFLYIHNEHNKDTKQIHSIAQQQCHKTQFEQIHKDKSEDKET
jgi:hypothetical protein